MNIMYCMDIPALASRSFVPRSARAGVVSPPPASLKTMKLSIIYYLCTVGGILVMAAGCTPF